mgnify:CR=1 FL=1
MKISSLKRDSAKAEEGQWIDKLPGMGDLRLKVRGLSSFAFVRCHGAKQRAIPLSERAQDGSIKDELSYQLYGEALADAILLDWDGIEADDGNSIAFDRKMAETWLTDPDYSHFADAVHNAAQRVDNQTQAKTEEVAKNSEGSSKAK